LSKDLQKGRTLSALSLVQSKDRWLFISNISVRTFPNPLSSTVQFVLDCTLTDRRFIHHAKVNEPKYVDRIIGKIEFVEVDLHTLQGVFREFEQGQGSIKVNLSLDELE